MFMKYVLNWLLPLVIILNFSACSKSGNNGQKVTTGLQLTMTDSMGNKMTGAAVALYSSSADWASRTNPVATAVTDANGIVNFDSLSAIPYFWYASLDCRNNSTGIYTTNVPLIPNKTTTITTILYEKGKIQFVNISADPYQIYVNGILVLTQNGNVTSAIANMPIGSYTVRVLQVSGYTTSPKDETFTGSITCGSTLTITFP
jgi:hypothetical protein